MPKFSVIIPCTRSIAVEVEAEDEKSAKTAAFDLPFRCEIKAEDGKTVDIEILELAAHEQIVKGNVFYGVQNEVEVTQID
jgi:hypothetical protein